MRGISRAQNFILNIGICSSCMFMIKQIFQYEISQQKIAKSYSKMQWWGEQNGDRLVFVH